MSDLIKEFYKNAGTLPILLERKTACFERNPDIAQEFEYWITNKRFKSGDIEEQGYSMIDFKWSNFCLEGLNLNRFATGAAQPGLSVANVLNVLLPLPPFNEQRNIGQMVDKALIISNNLGTEKDILLEIIAKTKSKILDLAIRGKLVSQNETDEPASDLLERIRSEKDALIKQGKLKRDKKESIVYKGDDNSYYEKLSDGTINCIDEDLPFNIPSSWSWERVRNLFIVNPKNTVDDDIPVSFIM